MTTDSDGCIELTCEIGDFPIAVAAFADSEIPPPTAAADELVSDDLFVQFLSKVDFIGNSSTKQSRTNCPWVECILWACV